MKKTIIAHAVSTWAGAHGFNFIILFVLTCFTNGHIDVLAGVAFMVLITLVASLPVIPFLWLVLHLIIDGSFSPRVKLFVWVLLASILVAINALLLSLLIGEGELDDELKHFTVGFGGVAVASTIIAILIRSKNFFSLNQYFTEKKFNEENNSDNNQAL